MLQRDGAQPPRKPLADSCYMSSLPAPVPAANLAQPPRRYHVWFLHERRARSTARTGGVDTVGAATVGGLPPAGGAAGRSGAGSLKREWTWWALTGGGKGPAFKPRTTVATTWCHSS